jgi:hypothetical protein
VNRSIQFSRDQFGTDIRFRHSSEEVILVWGPAGGTLFKHDTVSDVARSPSGLCFIHIYQKDRRAIFHGCSLLCPILVTCFFF